mmetsp:Transcript_82779/g.219745  ORF Transcript_82779/g.219745 Transcript_82779/m.219745 type:complete len:254 (+) Transcript_82779:228-989(+)
MEDLLLGGAEHGELRLGVAAPEELAQVLAHDFRTKLRIPLQHVGPQGGEEHGQVVWLDGRLAEEAVRQLRGNALPDVPRQHIRMLLHGVEVPQELESILGAACGEAGCGNGPHSPGPCNTAGCNLRIFGGGVRCWLHTAHSGSCSRGGSRSCAGRGWGPASGVGCHPRGHLLRCATSAGAAGSSRACGSCGSLLPAKGLHDPLLQLGRLPLAGRLGHLPEDLLRVLQRGLQAAQLEQRERPAVPCLAVLAVER